MFPSTFISHVTFTFPVKFAMNHDNIPHHIQIKVPFVNISDVSKAPVESSKYTRPHQLNQVKRPSRKILLILPFVSNSLASKVQTLHFCSSTPHGRFPSVH